MTEKKQIINAEGESVGRIASLAAKKALKGESIEVVNCSKAIITGDITQIDLPKRQTPGLTHALEILKHIKNIGFCYFDASDIVRHPLVQEIVKAYSK